MGNNIREITKEKKRGREEKEKIKE